MPQTSYLKVTIEGQPVDIEAPDALPISINYNLEDENDLQKTVSSNAFNIRVPASLNNDQLSNTFHNPSVEDLTADQHYRKPRQAAIEANGYELLNGKAFLTEATHQARPVDYEYNFYGDNADWIIDLRERTLFDCLRHITFPFTKQQIIDSWSFNGMSQALPYVFAPVRYGQKMADGVLNYVQNPPAVIPDYNMKPEYFKPSLSVYWILFFGFRLAGYRIQSDFFNTNYFRRAVMPWTWGNFLSSQGTRLENLYFMAKAPETYNKSTTFNGVIPAMVTNDSSNGAFDNSGTYNYNVATNRMEWTYLPAFPYGGLQAHFHAEVFINALATANSEVELTLRWYLKQNGSSTTNLLQSDTLVHLDAPVIGKRDYVGSVHSDFAVNVSPGDLVSCELHLRIFETSAGRADINLQVTTLEMQYFTLVAGATIDFANYNGLKKWKFLDLVKGVKDAFNLKLNTDPVNKVVYIEPAHDYSLTDNPAAVNQGYYNGEVMDWQDKQDLSRLSAISLHSDGERELVFKFKDDPQDGLLKKIQDRYQVTLGAGKYVLPERYKSGKKEVVNSFFSPVIHYDVEQWKNFTGTAPQIVCLIPDNVSDTSADEAQNTFQPKLCWYKGIDASSSWIFDGSLTPGFPFMFAVNYRPGGQEDPVFSYSDEKVGNDASGYVIGRGLLKRFYWQRLAILRNGQFYKTWLNLNNFDVANQRHREYKIIQGQRWELLNIKDYKPLQDASTEAKLRKWAPVSQAEADNTFPSSTSVLTANTSGNGLDIKYSILKCISTDINK